MVVALLVLSAAQTAYSIGHVAAPGTDYGHYWVIVTAP